MEHVSFYESEQGRGAVVATELGISRVYLPGDCLDDVLSGPDAADGPSTLTERAAHMLQNYFKGVPQPFETLALDYQVSGTFRRAILESIRPIPFGEVRSYAQVAAAACAPRAARAVGGAMAANPLPIIIPCHRVVASGGGLTGYSAAGGVHMKQFLLRLEGVEFTRERVKFSAPVIHR